MLMRNTMRMTMKIVPLLVSFTFVTMTVVQVVMVVSQEQQQDMMVWNGCINPAISKNQNLVRIQQLTRICIAIANDTNWNTGMTSYVRASFEPQADIYSRFHIPNSYRDLVQKKNSASGSIFSASKTITVSASSQTALSFVRVYYDTETNRIFPFLTAIMDVNQGVITSITWDNACVFCGGTECIENTYNYNGIAQNQDSAGQPTRSCSITTEDCDTLLSTNSSSTVCDLTIYTVWTGTDANGIALQSQAYRFSAFPPQQLSDRITQLLIPDGAADIIQNSNNGNNNNKNTTTTRDLLALQHSSAMQQVMEEHYIQMQQQHISSKVVTTGSTKESDL